ncbi:hypothetical protein [Niallia sp. BSM11]|uniref:hypothetical protein n=1 Tax=Niallia sp. BSM11 TaxID=3391576 RepID=UPI0039854250
MARYARYKSANYPLNIRNNTYRLKSNNKESGFKVLVDLGGNVHDNIFIKEVDIDEIELIFERKYKVIYKGKEYDTFAIGELVINDGKIKLVSSDSEDYHNKGFEKQEQFVFTKNVRIEDIDALVEIIEPIMEFNNLPVERKIIPSTEIKEFIDNELF